jgi:hypothetical protein
VKLTAIAALVAALGAGSAAPAFAKDLMSKEAYKAEKDRIEAEYKVAKEACNKLSGNAEDVCKAEAKGKQRIAEADLDAKNQGTAKAQVEARNARAEAAYLVAREKCDDLAGNAKDVCVKEAKAAETKAIADAKATQKVAAVRQDAREDKMEADYKVAMEKCDALAGAAKDSCQSAAKAKYKK